MRFVLFIALLGLFEGAVRADPVDETECVVHGLVDPVPVGQSFRHPENKCWICECCRNGEWSCAPRVCPAQPCGINKQTAWSEDGCCKECCDECAPGNTTCPHLNCGANPIAYPHDSCCPSCGCYVDLGNVVVTVPEGPYGHVCEDCLCVNGEADCNRPPCPAELLECINPSFDANCSYICPTGPKTCRRGDYIIPGGAFIEKRYKVCTCNMDKFYTRGFCFNQEELLGKKFRVLQDEMCVADPLLPPILPDPTLLFQEP